MRFCDHTPLLPVALLFLPINAPAGDLNFTGNLRFVSTTTITIRLANGIVIDARLPKTGELAPEKLATQYKFADRVQIACKSIHSVWDESVKRYHSL